MESPLKSPGTMFTTFAESLLKIIKTKNPFEISKSGCREHGSVQFIQITILEFENLVLGE